MLRPKRIASACAALVLAAGMAPSPALADDLVAASCPGFATQDYVADPGLGGWNGSGASGSDDADAGQVIDIDQVKVLIDALTYDPYQVKLADKEAVEAAQAAYEALSEDDQRQLDVQEAGNHVLTYGRTLQCALWGLYTLTPVDNATSLRDGTYTSQFISTCNMGKSSSSRGFKFEATKLVVEDGRAYATIEHATSSPDTLKSGGILYNHSNADESGKSTFDIPVKLNSVFYVSQMAKARTANTVAIPYEMSIQVNERTATPDAESPASRQNGAATSSGAKSSAGQKNDDKPKPKLGPGAAHKAGPAAAQASGASKDAKADDKSKAGAKAEKDGGGDKAGRDGDRRAKGLDSQTKKAEGFPADGGDGAATEAVPDDARDYAPYAAGSTIALVGAGALAFALDYRRRDGKAVDVSGVGIAKDR